MATASTEERQTDRAELSWAYQPIVRGYFIVAAIYYGIMTVAHFVELSGMPLRALATCSVSAWVACSAASQMLRRPRPTGQIEVIVTAINLIVLTNVIVALQIEYAPAKLVYFVMMAMIFAIGGISMRQAALSIAAALAGLFWQLALRDPGQLPVYGLVSFAAALSALAIAFFLQRAIGLAVTARHEADKARVNAERRLAAAERIGEAMRRRSLSDSLTALPNRRAFFEVFEQARGASAHGETVWLILLDLDGFKAVNDNYGHIMGDELLKAVARRLCDYCGDEAHVSRMGGDEFNIVLSSSACEDGVERWCETLLEQLAHVYLIDDRLIQISGSIGCHAVDVDESEAKQIQKADYALLHAKRHGKNRVILFRDEHEEDAAERFRIEQALRVADFSAEIELLFQPQFDLARGRMVCAEALARWKSPLVGDVGPDRFIRIAEESGLIAKITLAVLDKALAALAGWERPIPLSINLSGHDLLADQIIEQIVDRVRRSGLAPALIEFEVTETAMMSDTRRASANLLRLSALGHPIALDDFGTGYSNFSYLRTLPISKLKVDRSFMENLGDPMTEKILHSLGGMARTLDVHCLLEGIESELELLMARRIGAQSVQGYLFGVPMSADALWDC
ncbi:MAG: EAL domain-containing protein, partial [Sphingomonadales bacterium]|nr:EAL domain-containing protein [Sphingomonadales bacterium]